MVGLFRQDATGGFPKGLYLMKAREDVVEIETFQADLVVCPTCGIFAEISTDERGKVRPCSECGTSLRVVVKGIELDRIYWR